MLPGSLRIQSLARGLSSKFHIQRFSTKWAEPEHMVRTEAKLDPSKVFVPVVLESVKADMYKKYKTSPEEWTLTKLSQNFGTSLERTKAILVLMQRREEFKIANNVSNIPQQWSDIYKKHIEAPETATADVLAAEYTLDKAEVESIILRMKDHTNRQANVDSSETLMEQKLETLKEMGVDTRFRETPVTHGRRSLEDNYYPELFGDDGYEAAKQAVLKRVKAETKASVEEDTSAFLAKGNAPAELKVAADPNAKLSRWKLAYKDLSSEKAATIICTRDGRRRDATALEEAIRSWVKNPTRLDMAFNREQLKKFEDPDGDDEATKKLVDGRREHRKALVAAGKENKKK